MTTRCFAVLVALILTILSALGCGAKPIGSPKKPQPSADSGPSVTVTYRPGAGAEGRLTAEELVKRYEEEDRLAAEAHAKLLDALAKDPSPVHALAVKTVADYLPEAVGDRKAKNLEVVLDEGETETFGGAKWVVHGRLVERGSPPPSGDSGRVAYKANTTWRVEVRAEDAKIRAATVSVR